jgi:hypothetical protein
MSKIKLNLDSLKSRRDWKRHKIKDGQNIYRILPPFGENSNGYPYHKYQIIWGLLDPETGRKRPYASSRPTEGKCPVVEFVEELKKQAEALKSQLQAAGESEEAIKEELSGINTVIRDLAPKTIYVYNAADKAGEVGLLELKSTAHKKLKKEMNDYINDYNQDPTSLSSDDDDSGVWFNVIRSGINFDTEYDVKRSQNKAKNEQGRLVFEDDRSPLAQSIVENYNNLGYDLTSVYQVKSYEDLQDVLGANMPRIQAAIGGQVEETQVKVEQKQVVPTKATNKVNLKLDDEDEEDESEAVSAPVKSAPVQAKTRQTAVVVADDDDDFLAQANALLNS